MVVSETFKKHFLTRFGINIVILFFVEPWLGNVTIELRHFEFIQDFLLPNIKSKF